jgi:hypothetical protein
MNPVGHRRTGKGKKLSPPGVGGALATASNRRPQSSLAGASTPVASRPTRSWKALMAATVPDLRGGRAMLPSTLSDPRQPSPAGAPPEPAPSARSPRPSVHCGRPSPRPPPPLGCPSSLPLCPRFVCPDYQDSGLQASVIPNGLSGGIRRKKPGRTKTTGPWRVGVRAEVRTYRDVIGCDSTFPLLGLGHHEVHHRLHLVIAQGRTAALGRHGLLAPLKPSMACL